MITIIPYQEKYEQQVQSLFEIPVSGSIALSLQRQPHTLLGARVQTENPKILLAVETGQDRVIGITNFGTRSYYLDGKTVLMPYYCDFRIHPDYQNGSVFLKIVRFIKDYETNLNQIPASTIVFADNHRMLTMIKKRSEGKLAGLVPYYEKITDIETFIFKWSPKKFSNHRYTIRIATETDIKMMQDFEFQNQRPLMLSLDYSGIGKTPYYFDQKISDYVLCLDSGNLVGMLGLWDTSSFKQTVVQKYNAMLRWIRPIYNFAAGRFFSFPTLPPTGQKIKTTSIHALLIADRNPIVFQSLLDYLTRDGKKTYMLTLDQKDPLCFTMRQIYPAIRKVGHYFLITTTKQNMKPFDWIPVDVARI